MPARLHIALAQKLLGTSERHSAGNSRTGLPEGLHWSSKQESSHSAFEGLDLFHGRTHRVAPRIADKSKGALSSDRRPDYTGPSDRTRNTSVADPTISLWPCRSLTMSPCQRPSRFYDPRAHMPFERCSQAFPSLRRTMPVSATREGFI